METNTRHSLLYKHKHFRDKTQTKLTSNSTKLSGASREAPINVDGGEELYDGGSDSPVVIRREESGENDEAVVLGDIPTVAETEEAAAIESGAVVTRRSKRRRRESSLPRAAEDGEDEGESGLGHDADNDYAPVDAIQLDFSGEEDEDGDSDNLFVDNRPSKRRKEKDTESSPAPPAEDKKKMAMDISYEGFAIYGRVLCLVVKRRGTGQKTAQPGASNKSLAEGSSQIGNQAVMENWIKSTQMPAAEVADEMEA